MSLNSSYLVRNNATNMWCVAIGYALAGCLVVAMGGLLLMAAATSTARHFGTPPWIGPSIGIALGVGFAVVTIVYGVRDFRKNFSAPLILDTERLALPTLNGQIEIPLSEIESLRFRKAGHELLLAIRTAGGSRHVLPKWFSRTDNLAETLHDTIVPSIAGRWGAAIRAGGEIELTENRMAAFGRLVLGFLMAPVALGCILSIKAAGTGLSLMRDAHESFYVGGRGLCGKLVIDTEGIRRGKARLAWDEIESIESDDFGAVIQAVKGKPWRISTYIDNFLPLHLVVSSFARTSEPSTVEQLKRTP